MKPSRYWLALLAASVLPLAIAGIIAATPLGEASPNPLLIAGGIASAGVAIVAFVVSRRMTRLAADCQRILGVVDANCRDEFDSVTSSVVAIEERRQATEEKLRSTIQHLAATVAKLGEGVAELPELPEGESSAALALAAKESAKKVMTLRQRNATTGKILQELATPVFAVDDHGIVRFANVAAETLFGKRNLAKRDIRPLLGPGGVDPFGTTVLNGDGFAQWLNNGGMGEAVIEVPHDDGPARIAVKGTRFRNSVEGVWYLAARDLTEDYRRASIDRAETREHALRAVWEATAKAGSEPIDGMLAATRMLTSDAKQGNDRDTMLTRVNSLRQNVGGLEAYIRSTRWLHASLWGELPPPMVTEFLAVEPVKTALDQLAPKLKARNITVSVNDNGGWVCGDDEWLRTALLGILAHVSETVSDAAVGVKLSRKAPAAGTTEESAVFEVIDAGPPLSAAQMGDLESPFGGLTTPSFLQPNADGFMPGLILAVDLTRRMGGMLEFDTTPGGSLLIRLVLPTRAATGVVEVLPEPIEFIDELVMGWKLGVA